MAAPTRCIIAYDDPLLVKYVTEQLTDTAEIQKQARKAREEQAASREAVLPRPAAPAPIAPVAGSLLVPPVPDPPAGGEAATEVRRRRRGKNT